MTAGEPPRLLWPKREVWPEPSPCEVSVVEEVGEPSQNTLAHGDNLAMMAHLVPRWAGRFRCAYLDPPYNTGAAYRHYADGTSRGAWLSELGARLRFVRELLAPDGVVMLSIDDGEGAWVELLLDDVFGRDNRCGCLIWEKKRKPSFLDATIASITERILVYAKERQTRPPLTHGVTPEKLVPLNNAGNGIGVLSFPPGSVRFGFATGAFEPADMSTDRVLTRLLDPLEVRDHRNVGPFRLEGEWRYSQQTLDAVLERGEPLVIRRVPFRPNHVRPPGRPKLLKNLLSRAHYDAPTYEDATTESRALFGEDAFDYPKPEGLLRLLLEASTAPGDWVLDPYGGSGTTAAVAHKMHRCWLLIEQGAHARTLAHRRLSRVVAGRDPGGVTEACGWAGGGGYRLVTAAG